MKCGKTMRLRLTSDAKTAKMAEIYELVGENEFLYSDVAEIVEHNTNFLKQMRWFGYTTKNGNKWKLANMVIERMRTKSNRIARVWRASWQPVGMTLDKKFYLVRPINPGNYGRNFSHGYFETSAYDSNIDQIPIYQEVENGI